MKMIQIGHQGDTQWYKVTEIPKDAKKIKKQFIAASERSGSFHALFGNYDMYEIEDGFVIDAKEDCIINHSLKTELDKINNDLSQPIKIPKKDHRHSVLKKGIYLAGIQNQFDPHENTRKRVID